MRVRYLVLVIICVGAALAFALNLRWSASPLPQATQSSSPVVVVSTRSSARSTPTPLATSAERNVEEAIDTATIEPYRAAVHKMLGLGGNAVFREVVVANDQQHIVCGQVSHDGTSFQRFVYVGTASIGALDDGSSDFKEMRRGACGNATSPK